MSLSVLQILKRSPVMPVLVIDKLDDAVPLAKALYDGGLNVLEVTLRSPVALEAITLIHKALPKAIVGAGTILSEEDMDAATQHGAQFLVSPGCHEHLAQHALTHKMTFLPGVATPSEAMSLFAMGFTELKFFPAQAAGGIPMLKSIFGPLPQLTFCPTGGIDLKKAADYLTLPNVACVGGSWMVTQKDITDKNWVRIQNLACEAARLGGK